MEAILLCNELAYTFPTGLEDLNTATHGFESISTNGIISGCVACVDGFLLQIQTPTSKETGNVKAYFSGHYQSAAHEGQNEEFLIFEMQISH
jgi:hypothetical protein